MARRSVMSPTFTLRRNALYKGFLGGSRGWMAVGIVLWGSKLMKKSFGRTPQYLSTERLEPGQAVRIEAIPPLSRSERRAARRAR
jgi:hypothetical protein